MSFSFGTPSSAPANTGLSGGFNFAAKPTTPGFGLTATTQPSTMFGTPATSAPAFGNTSFGAAATPQFGATSTAPTFGSAAPAFGATSTAAPTFGAAPALGTTPAFGSAAPAFGASSTPAFGASNLGTGLGAGGLNFGAGSNVSAPSTGLSFGTTTTTASAGLGGLGGGGLGVGGLGGGGLGGGGLGGFGFGASTAGQTNTGLFGLTSTATTANSLLANCTHTSSPYTRPVLCNPSTPIHLRSVPPQNATFLELSPIKFEHVCNCEVCKYQLKSPKRDCYGTITPCCGGGLGTTSVTGTQPTTLVTPSLGLGGVAPTTGTGAANATDAKTEPPKQTKLPNEISTSVESFKEFVKKQKSLSSEVMRVSIKPLHEVSREAESTLRLALSLSGEVSKARAHSRRLRGTAAAALASAETAARDTNTPGLELETSAPPVYVKELVSELEQQLITFRRQMDVAVKQMQASPKLLTEQELMLGIRRMHECMVALAGRLQAVHSQVEAQKEQYLNLRKYVLKDPTNVFDSRSSSTSLDQILKDAETSKKKIKTGNMTDISFGSAVLSDPRAALGSIQQLAGPTPFSYLANTLSPFPNTDTSGPGWQPSSQPAPTPMTSLPSWGSAPAAESSFQLQKPPGKRGKQ